MKQILLKNGFIVTMAEGSETVYDGGSVLIEDDKIKAVGQIDPRMVAPDAEIMELNGKYVLPGFVNTHVHTSQQISRGVGDDVDFVTWLHKRMWPFESNMTEEDSYISTLATCLELIKSGVTSFAEPGGQFVSGMCRATAKSGLRRRSAPHLAADHAAGAGPAGGGPGKVPQHRRWPCAGLVRPAHHLQRYR